MANSNTYKTSIENAKLYRKYDDDVSSDENWIWYKNQLLDVCNSFNRKINVLDIGCGTGRFFSALENVDYLYGLDFSEPMINEAHNPHFSDLVKKNIKDIEFIISDYTKLDVYSKINKKIDFIFSIGLMNEYNEDEISPEFFNTVYNLLSDDGVIWFSIMDSIDNVKNLVEDSVMYNKDVMIDYYTKTDEKADEKTILKVRKQ
tara:strand:- start:110 stop:718 length:609 start_codon:yes stop_codon:yes gene_type:complete